MSQSAVSSVSPANNDDGSSTAVHPAFEWKRSEPIPALNLVMEEYVHRNTGAMHYHLAADNPENVFLVALRTLPEDSTGVAHILEHTALCGSKHYPVRDPFFMMIRRSLNTFMNAFTSSDWTAYPFASQNRKDFDNLLAVYLDAVFFSRLDELDFLQEGHRLEFSEPENPDSELQYKGVVFNEMKGAMSSISSTLWQTVSKYLYPNTTYHYNSGGDPEHIPDLSYQQLKAFYRTHYHPSNAIFMTYGDITAYEHQEKFENLALKEFSALNQEFHVDDEKRYYAPVRIQESYAFDEPGATEKKTHIVMAWLLGKNTNLEDSLIAQLISSLLLDNSAAPLQHLLETSKLGTAPSPMVGLEDSNHELAFLCGIQGSEAGRADEFEQQVLDCLERVAQEGFSQDRIEAVLHQLELHQREIGGDSYPYGLQLILTALPSATHRGDPIKLLNLEPVLEMLREKIKDPDFVKNKIRELLLENPHRVRLVMTPDQTLAKKRETAEKQKLADIKAHLSDDQKTSIINTAKLLLERQHQKDDESILPKVTLADVPETLFIPEGEADADDKLPVSFFAQGTNGLVYEQIIIDLPELDMASIDLLPYYTQCLTELGVGDKSYLDTQHWQSEVCGSITAFTSSRGKITDVQDVSSYLVLSSKALTRNHKKMAELLRETLFNVRFDETSRIREIVAQMRARREQSVTGNGHGLAMLAATSGFSPTAAMSHRLSGLLGIKSIKALDTDLNDTSSLESFAQQIAALHKKIIAAPRQFLVVAEHDKESGIIQELNDVWEQAGSGRDSQERLTLDPVSFQSKQVWKANSQVNFCAKAYPTVPMKHPDAAALTVLGPFLRNGFLHRAIREQGGAYGSGANQDSNIAAFKFFSYRDPRLQETLNDFDRSIEWLLTQQHEPQKLEEAILNVISSIDKPSSPAGEAKQAFHNELFGRTPEERRAFRTQVLHVTVEDLQRVAKTYLTEDKASIAVLTNASIVAENEAFFSSAGFEQFEV